MTGLMEYAEYFPFGVEYEVSIPVMNCFKAPSQYVYRTLTVSYVNELVKSFAMLSKHPATCAYLMPFHKETNIPMHKEEV